MKEPRSEPEQIAQLLDGRLQGPERARLLERLATSDEFRELLETAAVLREAEEEDPPETLTDQRLGGSAVPRPLARPAAVQPPPAIDRLYGWRARPGRWLRLAAVLAVAALAPLLWWRGNARLDHPGVPTLLLARSEAELPPGWTERPVWERTLGAGDPLGPAARAVRAGALHTGLVLAVRGGDAAQAARLRAQLVELLDRVPGTASLAARYRELGTGSPPAAERLEPAGKELAAALGADNVLWGAWLEAARIAAARRDAAFFRARQSRTVLERAAEQRGRSDPSQAAATRLRASVAGEAPMDWPGVQRDLDELLRAAAS